MIEKQMHEIEARSKETRYAYYRRCQVFRRNGEQCKAPAEKGSDICYAHAGQRATALRRERELRAVLAEVVSKMRQRGRPDFQSADIFMDFNAIQVAIATMAQALIDGTMDCKTAGRLGVALQTASKLLWLYHKARQKEKVLTTKDTKEHKERSGYRKITPFGQQGIGRSGDREETAGDDKITGIRMEETIKVRSGRSTGPPGWARAA